MKHSLKKRGLDVRQARRMVHDRNVWHGFVRGEYMGCSLGDESLTLMIYYNCEMLQPYEALEGQKFVSDQSHNLGA